MTRGHGVLVIEPLHRMELSWLRHCLADAADRAEPSATNGRVLASKPERVGRRVVVIETGRVAEAPRVKTMKAVVQDRYGTTDVLELADIGLPVIQDNEVLLRVGAAAVNPLDWFSVKGGMGRVFFGIRRPRIRVRGIDVAGTVEGVGKDVTQFAPGDSVYGGARGSMAEYAPAKASQLALKPASLTFEQAAAVPIAGITALRALRDVAKVQRGQKVLINGAAGGVGTFAVQIATALGAEVTGVCSTAAVELVRSLGATRVVDYTVEDYTRTSERYDVILDNIGNHRVSESRRVLTDDGVFIWNSGKAGFGPIIQVNLLRAFVRQKLRFFIATLTTADLDTLCGMIDSGALSPVIDRTYSLAEAPRAIAQVGAGHVHGKVVVSI